MKRKRLALLHVIEKVLESLISCICTDNHFLWFKTSNLQRSRNKIVIANLECDIQEWIMNQVMKPLYKIILLLTVVTLSGLYLLCKYRITRHDFPPFSLPSNTTFDSNAHIDSPIIYTYRCLLTLRNSNRTGNTLTCWNVIWPELTYTSICVWLSVYKGVAWHDFDTSKITSLCTGNSGRLFTGQKSIW